MTVIIFIAPAFRYIYIKPIIMATPKSLKKKSQASSPDTGKRELIKGKENLLIDKEKRYQKKIKGPQVENQTMLKETKKKPAPKVSAKKKAK
jgi:hypothetical protein